MTCQALAGAWSKTARIGASAMTRRDLSSTLPLKSTAATVVSPASSWWRWSWPSRLLARIAARSGCGLVRSSRVAILHPLPQGDRTAGIIACPEADRSLQAIVGLEDERPFAVAPLDFVAQRVQHHAAQTGIDAVDAPGTVGEVVGVAKGDAVQRVRHREHIAANVVGGARAKLLDRRQRVTWVSGASRLRAMASTVRPRASITMLDGVK